MLSVEGKTIRIKCVYSSDQNSCVRIICDGLTYISVKATTEEGMGFTGEGKGVSATSVVLITKL